MFPIQYVMCRYMYVRMSLCIPQASSSAGVSLAVGAERKRGADQQDALMLAAQLRAATSQGGGGAATSAKNGASGGGGDSIEKEKKLKNLRKVDECFIDVLEWQYSYTATIPVSDHV